MAGESFYRGSELRTSSKLIPDHKTSFGLNQSKSIRFESINSENHLKSKLLKEHQS